MSKDPLVNQDGDGHPLLSTWKTSTNEWWSFRRTVLVLVSLAEGTTRKHFLAVFLWQRTKVQHWTFASLCQGLCYISPDLYMDTYMSQYTHTQHLFQPQRFEMERVGSSWPRMEDQIFWMDLPGAGEHELVDSMRKELQTHTGYNWEDANFRKNWTIIQQRFGWKLIPMMRTCMQMRVSPHMCLQSIFVPPPISRCKPLMNFLQLWNLALTTLAVHFFGEVHPWKKGHGVQELQETFLFWTTEFEEEIP